MCDDRKYEIIEETGCLTKGERDIDAMSRLLFGREKSSCYAEVEESEEGLCVASKIFLMEKIEG